MCEANPEFFLDSLGDGWRNGVVGSLIFLDLADQFPFVHLLQGKHHPLPLCDLLDSIIS